MAVVLIRGTVSLSPDVKKALDLLMLRRKHCCVLLKNTESNMGQLFKLKDYITYGEIDESTLKQLQDKRGDKQEDGTLKPFYRLSPPKGGFNRKGIKKPYSIGGALGYRGQEINTLLRRMI